MSLPSPREFLRLFGYGTLCLCLAFADIQAAYAEGFAEPPEITNREKAHLDVSFTGGGTDSEEEDTGCSAETPSIGSVSESFSLGGDEKERRVSLIKALMSDFGLTAEQAAGPVGNFMTESAGTVTEARKLPPDVNQGDVQGAPPNGGELGYGWAQWSGGRKTSFVQHINSTGFKTPAGNATDAADYSYLTKDLTGSYKSTITDLKKQSSPEEAAVSFEATYEKAGRPVLDERKRHAREAFENYQESNGGAGGSADSGTSSGCGTSSSANFGEVAFPLKGSKSVVKNPGMFHDGTTDRGGHPYIAYDILADPGEEVVAFASGTVTYESSDRCGGLFITIWNEQAKLGVTYMHMSEHIKKGAKVEPGDHVGVVGSAAHGCGTPHLHIDAATDKTRQACSRLGCSILNHFRSLDKELFETFQALPG